jgi:hypothetical protein
MARKSTTPSGGTIRRYTSIPSVVDLLRRKKLALLSPASWDDKNDRYFMELYKKHRKAGGLYALCAARGEETYHHWKVFTGGGTGGACVLFKRDKLEDFLGSFDELEGTRVRFGDVKYLDLADVRRLDSNEIENLPFLKRSGFGDEDEYRIVIETTKKDQGAVYIDCPISWIDRIYLNPWLPKLQAESLIATIKDIEGCGDVDVRRSYLIDSTTWKNAGDKVAGNKSKSGLTLIFSSKKTTGNSTAKSNRRA